MRFFLWPITVLKLSVITDREKIAKTMNHGVTHARATNHINALTKTK
jgi:hypothetical protein